MLRVLTGICNHGGFPTIYKAISPKVSYQSVVSKADAAPQKRQNRRMCYVEQDDSGTEGGWSGLLISRNSPTNPRPHISKPSSQQACGDRA
jgi:hypothetical protein